MPFTLREHPLKNTLLMEIKKEGLNVYLSYAHEDIRYADEFMKHLNILRRSGIIQEIFINQDIKPGKRLDDSVREFLDRAAIVIFFISPDFLSSRFINDQILPYALEKYEMEGTQIFPILIRPALFDDSPLRRFMVHISGQKAISKWENRDEAWIQVVGNLKQAINSFASQAARKLIEHTRISRAKILDLGNCGLKGIPAEVFELEWLEGLILGNSKPPGSNEQMLFYPDINEEELKAAFDNHLWFTKNEGGPNDLAEADLTSLTRLQNLRFINVEDCNINIRTFDFSLFDHLAILLAANNQFSSWPLLESEAIRPRYSRGCPALKLLDISRNNLPYLSADFFEAIAASIEYLNLEGNFLNKETSLQGLEKCRKLLYLDLSSNKLHGTSQLEHLEQLKWLNLNRTELTDISALQKLTHLEYLYLNDNGISNLSPLIHLSQLKWLSIKQNHVSIEPLGRLTGLTGLHIQSNKISDISALQGLKNLQLLEMSDNDIKDIKPLGSLVNLRSLGAYHNKIADLKPLASCKNLWTLVLSENAITDLNEIRYLLQQVPGLTDIYLQGNPLASMDASILEHLHTANDFRNYFRDMELKGHVQNQEVKLILVGNSTAGKSTLRRMLQHKSFTDKEGTTHGIIKDEWKIPDPGNKDTFLKVNIWDFGGQEYYHETHKLFFSRNAVYVLVWEPGTDKNGVQETTVNYRDKAGKIIAEKKYIEHYSCAYWLKNIRHYAPESPVILVQNKIDLYFTTAIPTGQSRPRIKRKDDQLLAEYGIYDSFEVSLGKVSEKDEDFIFDYKKFVHILKKRLVETASHFELETNFYNIREEIVRRESAHKWTRSDFDRFCLGHDPDINLNLLINYLKDISVILYFPERKELQDLVFINPIWVSEQIFKVLDSEVLANSGHFPEAHVIRKLGEGLAQEFLELMKQFQIIFRDERRQEYIAPQYLPDSNINRYYSLVKAQFLQPRFVLEFPRFLPKTIMNNILSRYAGQAIESSYYKYGVAFSTDYDSINILEYDFNKNQISFYSKLNDQFNIREVFESILAIFENISIGDSTLTSMDAATENILRTEKVKVLLSLDGETFINWNKLFLSRSQQQENFVLIPDRGKEIHAGAFSTFYQPKDDIRKQMTFTGKKEPVKLFVSYAHKDEAFKDELLEHLSGLQRQGIIQHWTDRAILPGEKWDETIKRNLKEAQVILFLVSPSFMASGYIQDIEIKTVIEQSNAPNNQVTIVPVPVRPCDISSLPLKDFQGGSKDLKAVSSAANRDEAWLGVVENLKKLIQEKFHNTLM